MPSAKEEKEPLSRAERLAGMASLVAFAWLVVALGVLDLSVPDMSVVISPIAAAGLVLALAGFSLDILALWTRPRAARGWFRTLLVDPIVAAGCGAALAMPGWLWSTLELADCVALLFVAGLGIASMLHRWRARLRRDPS